MNSIFCGRTPYGVINMKLDLSKPLGYPPNVSDNMGNKKKLNGPSHSGLRCLKTFGVVTTIRIIVGKSSQFGSFEGNFNARRKRNSQACFVFLSLFSFLWSKQVTESVPAGFFDVDVVFHSRVKRISFC